MTVEEVIRLERTLEDGSIITFEERPTGYRAYHFADAAGTRVRYPSVTTILGKVMPKRALMEWYEERGAEAATILCRQGALKGLRPDQAIEIVRGSGMGAKDAAKVAATRGIGVHAILQRWAEDGDVPNPSDYPADMRGYITGLVRWILHADPIPTAVEQLVAHPGKRYAGRYDLRAGIRGRDTLVDLKTNRRCQVYPEAALQVTGYAYADMEGGAPAPEALLMVAVGPDGTFAEAAPGYGTDTAWHRALDLYAALDAMQEPVEVAA